jgi:hypothetical protein
MSIIIISGSDRSVADVQSLPLVNFSKMDQAKDIKANSKIANQTKTINRGI